MVKLLVLDSLPERATPLAQGESPGNPEAPR